ncbi:hypothetical protein HK098_006383 [Nowakowskiella sp. JEL0407]|nr:hypothetical protein HK098_006383 [Nowakowskiella sp. JEL0407]
MCIHTEIVSELETSKVANSSDNQTQLSNIFFIVNNNVDLSISAVIPEKLFVSSEDVPQNSEILTTHEITHIVNLVDGQPGITYPEIHSINYLYFPLLDDEVQSLDGIDTVLDYIKSAIDANGKVLVHCQLGVSRSPAVCIAYIMREEDISMAEALRIVRVARSQALPNAGFLMQLKHREREVDEGQNAN